MIVILCLLQVLAKTFNITRIVDALKQQQIWDKIYFELNQSYSFNQAKKLVKELQYQNIFNQNPNIVFVSDQETYQLNIYYTLKLLHQNLLLNNQLKIQIKFEEYNKIDKNVKQLILFQKGKNEQWILPKHNNNQIYQEMEHYYNQNGKVEYFEQGYYQNLFDKNNIYVLGIQSNNFNTKISEGIYRFAEYDRLRPKIVDVYKSEYQYSNQNIRGYCVLIKNMGLEEGYLRYEVISRLKQKINQKNIYLKREYKLCIMVDLEQEFQVYSEVEEIIKLQLLNQNKLVCEQSILVEEQNVGDGQEQMPTEVFIMLILFLSLCVLYLRWKKRRDQWIRVRINDNL